MHVEETTLAVDGEQYLAEVTAPDDDADADHGVVLVPGAGHGPYGDVFDRLAGMLADHGVALLRYETWGESDGLPAPGEKTDEELFAELDAAVEELRERGHSRVGVVAKSFGGRIALRHTPGPVDALVLWAPFVFLEDGAAVDRMDVPEDVSPPRIGAASLGEHDRPVDILQGDDDNLPVENARELADALPDGRVHVIEGADHSFVGGDPEAETVRTTVELLTDSGE